MRSLLLFLLSIGIGLVTTWAGLHYDSGLLYAGYLLLAGTVILWLWTLRGSLAPAGSSLSTDPPISMNENQRMLWALRTARANAAFALTWRGRKNKAQAYRDVNAALLSAQKAFEIPPLKFKGFRYVPWNIGLTQQIEYIDSFYALLAEGHPEEAKRIASQRCVITFQS